MDTKTAHEHVQELHAHNVKAMTTFRTLASEVDKALPMPKAVRDAFDAHRKAIENAHSQSLHKTNQLDPNQKGTTDTGEEAGAGQAGTAGQ